MIRFIKVLNQHIPNKKLLYAYVMISGNFNAAKFTRVHSVYFGVFQASDYAYTTGYNQSAYTNPYAYYPYMTSGLSTSSIASQPPQTYQLITPPPTTTTTTTESSFTGTGSGSTPSPPLKSENGNNKNWSPPPSSPSDDKSDAGSSTAELRLVYSRVWLFFC